MHRYITCPNIDVEVTGNGVCGGPKSKEWLGKTCPFAFTISSLRLTDTRERQRCKQTEIVIVKLILTTNNILYGVMMVDHRNDFFFFQASYDNSMIGGHPGF